MNRNLLCRREAVALGLGALASATMPRWALGQGAGPGASASGPDGPNVLMICVDDLRPQLGCYGHGHVISPNIDRLAGEGTLCRRAYCQQAICGPSRASFLTGLRPETLDYYDLGVRLGSDRPGTVTLPQAFRDAGYTTVSLGKVFHHPEEHSASWDHEYRPGGEFTRGYVTEAARAGVRERAANTGNRPVWTERGPAYEVATDAQAQGHHDAIVARLAAAQLKRLKANGRPFFMAAGFKKPHLPFTAPKWAWDRYDRDAFDICALDDFPEGSPPYARNVSLQGAISELAAYFGIPARSPLERDLARTLIHGYHACVTWVDAMIGRLLEQLEDSGLAEHTLVVLLGDHGFKLSEYGSFCKHTNFEIDVHAPLIFRGPGVPRGAMAGGLCEFVDIAPTLLDMAGRPAMEACEGLSLSPLLADPSRPWKPAAFSQYPRGGARANGRNLMGDTLREDRYRYVRWTDRDSGELVNEELYDHRDSPIAVRNLLHDAAHAEALSRARALCDAGWRGARDAVINAVPGG